MLATAVVALFAFPGGALANVTISHFSVTPSTTAAGAHPDVTIDEQFDYGSSTSDSVKDTTLHFPPGLLGNPQATAKCSQTEFEADNCPGNTQLGTVTVGATAYTPVPVATSAPGTIYNLVPDSSHPAVLGIVVRPTLPGAGKIFLQSPVSLRTSTDFGIDSPVDNQPNTVSTFGMSTPVQITSTSLTLSGTPAGGSAPFMSNPTSCKPATTTLDAASYEAPGTTASATSTFTPTACDQLPFAPKISATMGAPGATAKGARVPFSATIIQAVGESSQSSATVTLPASLSSAVGSVSVLCTAAQLSGAACPDAARVGSATIASPLLPTPVQGPVFAILRPAQLPGVGVEFGGALPFTLGGNAALAAGGRLQNVFSGLPDVPLTSFTLSIDGGPHGLLAANRDICTGPAPTVDASFTAQSGAAASATAPVARVGCSSRVVAPRASASARGLAGRNARLSVTVRKGSDRLRSVTITLPSAIKVANTKKGLSATGAAFKLSRKSIRLSRRGRLTLKLPSRGASRVTATLGHGAIRAGAALKRKLHSRRSVKLTLVVRSVDSAGHHSTLRVKFSARR